MMRTYGFVYCLSNPALPGLYKIGHTLRSPHERARQLSSTGVPDEFFVMGYIEIESPEWWDHRFHLCLARFRSNDKREFFRCDVADIAPLFLRNGHALARWDGDFSPAMFQEGHELADLPDPYATPERWAA